MFTELLPLLAGRTLVLTVAQMDRGLIRVNVIPKCLKENDSSEKALTTPLSVTGTAADLDRDLPAQLTGFASAMLQTGSTLAQIQETHRAAIKEIEAENRKALESKRKTSGSKAPPQAESAAAVSAPVFKDGKPVFGSKYAAQPASLFDGPPTEASAQVKPSTSDDEPVSDDTPE